MICEQHQRMLDKLPLLALSSEKFDHEKSKQYVSLILAYNELPDIKKSISLEKLIKPLDKDGNNKGTLQQLTVEEMTICTSESKEILKAIHAVERQLNYVEPPEPAAPNLALMQETAEVIAQAEGIYKEGRFIEYCEDTFKKVWYGDAHVLRVLLYQSAVARMKNPDDGIHLHIAGKTQTGKSDAVRAALPFVHPDDQLTKKFSTMWLYYAKDIHARTILFSDDTTMGIESAEFFRSILTSWKTGCERGTVINLQETTQKIPARLSLILTSIESVCKESDEGQDESRFLTVNVKRNHESEAQIRLFFQEKHETIDRELKIVHAVWDIMVPETIEVELHRVFTNALPFREFKRYLSLVRAHAMLSGRTKTTEADVTAIDEFITNTTPMKDSTTAGFTNNEKVVYDSLSLDEWMSIEDIQEKTKMSYQQVSRAIRGARGTLNQPSGGLLVKSKIKFVIERSSTQNSMCCFKKFLNE